MTELIAKLEGYGFECEAGPLSKCRDWIELKAEIERLTAIRDAWRTYEKAERDMRWATTSADDVKGAREAATAHYTARVRLVELGEMGEEMVTKEGGS